MGSPSTRLPTELSQLLARWSAILQHLICPLASADSSREPVGGKPASQTPTASRDNHCSMLRASEKAAQGSGTRYAKEMALDMGNRKSSSCKATGQRFEFQLWTLVT